MPNHVLIIDDDEKLGRLLKTYLAQFNLSASLAFTPDEGLKAFHARRPDAVVLDVMLPGRDGFQICREIRELSGTPILMLTARGDLSDRVLGLELGADDYLPKPFEPRELAARLQSLLRRAQGRLPAKGVLKSGALRLDLDRRQAYLGEKNLDLGTQEFDLLALFMRNAGVALSRDKIMDSLHGTDWEAFNRSVDVAMSRLRKKLGDKARSPKFFKTAWGSGYLFIGKVDSHEAGRK